MAAKKQKRWSQDVTEHSNAMDLEGGVFTKKDPKAIARSLKRSAEQSKRRKSEPFRSAMSMLTFYINRAGDGLSKTQLKRLEKAKDELRELFGRERQHAGSQVRYFEPEEIDHGSDADDTDKNDQAESG